MSEDQTEKLKGEISEKLRDAHFRLNGCLSGALSMNRETRDRMAGSFVDIVDELGYQIVAKSS